MNSIRFVLLTIAGVIICFYAGAMFNFIPFVGDDLTIRAIGFCTAIICVVIVICTGVIIEKIEKNNKK